MVKRKYLITAGQWLLLSVVGTVNMFAQGTSGLKNQRSQMKSPTCNLVSVETSREVEKAATHFISIFRRNLDFRDAFDSMFVSNAIKRMRKARFFSNIGFNDDLVQTTDAAALKEAYIALMSFYYLQAIYDRNSPLVEELPSEIRNAFEKSKYLNTLNNGDDDHIVVTTRQEIAQYAEEFNQVAGLYKKYLPLDPLSNQHKSNSNNDDNVVRIRCGYPEYGINPKIKVYMFEKEGFSFYFIEERGEFRVLTLGIGN